MIGSWVTMLIFQKCWWAQCLLIALGGLLHDCLTPYVAIHHLSSNSYPPPTSLSPWRITMRSRLYEELTAVLTDLPGCVWPSAHSGGLGR